MPSHTFLRCGEYLKFLMWLGKFRQKSVTSYMFFPLWRLNWVFDETWKNFHKKVCPVTRFFAVESILSFWGDLESFDKKVWPVTHIFFRSADYLKFLMGLGKIFTKKCAQLHVLFAVETILSFGWELKKIWQKGVTSYTFSQWRLS